MDEKKIKHCPCIIVHGGAWSIPGVLVEPYRAGIQVAAKAGYEVLKNVSKYISTSLRCDYDVIDLVGKGQVKFFLIERLWIRPV